LRDTMAEAGVFVLVSVLLWLAPAALVTRRAKRLLQQTHSIATDPEPAPALLGQDELAKISRALREAHVQLIRQSRQLDAERRRYQRMVDTLSAMVYVNRNGRIEFIN